MTIQEISKISADLAHLRTRVSGKESDLQDAVAVFINQHGGVRAVAREIGISAAYMCDIVNRRRKVSAAVLGKLGMVK